MKYPSLEIDLKKLEYNVVLAVKELGSVGIEIMGVNKVFNGSPETAAAVVKAGIKTVAEARVGNLKKLQHLSCEKALLRSPALSEIEEVIRYSDISLNTEIEVIKALSKEAVKQKKLHKVLFMVDLGDLREGIWFKNREEIKECILEILSLPGIMLYGLGTNFNCYGTVNPTVENGKLFIALARWIETELRIKFEYLSGGSCTSYYLIKNGILPKGINHLRIGGLHEFGIEYVGGNYVEGYYHSSMDIKRFVSDLYIFRAEIIEVNRKLTVPYGEMGVDAFLQKKSFQDKGVRRRAILAFGRQDIPMENIYPVDETVKFLGQTSDHTLVDIEDCIEDYKVGDVLSFEIDYTALLMACNSPSVEKYYVAD